MSSSKAQFVFPDDQPLVCLDASSAWGHLTRDEQLYSHYLSQASWWGGLAVLPNKFWRGPDQDYLHRAGGRVDRSQQGGRGQRRVRGESYARGPRCG